MVINVKSLKDDGIRKLSDGLIAPAKEEVHVELAPDHTSEPLKNMEDIERISLYFKKNGKYRDNMLFIVGINFGLRVSDLRMLRFSDIINEDSTFKSSFPVFEKKTRNTRKKKKNRYITINDAVVEAVTLYLENTSGVSLSDYMFTSESNNGRRNNEPLSLKSIDRILKGVSEELGIKTKVSTHTLRKTFAYWVMVFGNNDYRRLLLLQKMFGHSTPAQTLAYIGLEGEEIEAAYMSLNLGGKKRRFLVHSNIVEEEVADNAEEEVG